MHQVMHDEESHRFQECLKPIQMVYQLNNYYDRQYFQ